MRENVINYYKEEKAKIFIYSPLNYFYASTYFVQKSVLKMEHSLL